MQWYYSNNNQQLGPVEDAELQALVSQGVIHAQTLIWREGMAEWQSYQSVFGQATAPAGVEGMVACPNCGAMTHSNNLIPLGDNKVVCPQCSGGYSQRLIEGASAPAGKPEGTGGLTPISELKAQARDCLSVQWGPAALFSFLIWMIQFGINMAAGMIPFVGFLVQYAVSGPFTLGYQNNMLMIARGEASSNDYMFSGFQDFKRAFGVYILPMLIMLVPIVIIGILAALMIPAMEKGGGGSDVVFGILAFVFVVALLAVAFFVQLKFGLSYFLLIDNPDLGVIETLKTSWHMMQGHTGKLFMLYISFIGWALLAMLTLGIGLFWLMPYAMVSFARFYDDL
ncbi:DUF975 family protein [Cerasicoccus maritimus]|uniref:DUF975 family protein n=1 Tax=Cerasicoccus maritimus TaxID=490089 RepID=UPI0028524B19|nr:DUF975 family protein [Cerasicoccus maritimus]